MKRIISFAVCVLLLIGALITAASAEDEIIYGKETSGVITWEFNKTTGVLTIDSARTASIHDYQSYNRPIFTERYGDSIKHVVIKENVWCVGKFAFYNCRQLESVTMSAVTEIRDSAFEGCESLKTVSMDSIRYIRPRAFKGCEKLEITKFSPEILHLDSEAFAGCFSLKNIEFPYMPTLVSPYAFSRCTGLETIEMGIPSHKYNVSGNCIIDKKTKALVVGAAKSVIPDDGSVEKIESKAFEGRLGLESISIPSSVKTISDYAFLGCSRLREVTIQGNELEYVEPKAFQRCSSLESIKILGKGGKYYTKDNCLIDDNNKLVLGCKNSIIPDDGSVTKIGREAFSGAEKLESIIIPAAVTDIGEWAFLECESLKSVYLSDSITIFKDGVFELCTSLEKVVICASKEDFKRIAYEPYYAEGAASFEIKRHDATLNQINYQMHAMHCKVCGNAEELEEHSSDSWKYVNDDTHTGVCKCGLKLERKHEWVESEWSIPATKKEQGMKKFTCDICDSERTEIIPRLRGCESAVCDGALAVVIAFCIVTALARRKKKTV